MHALKLNPTRLLTTWQGECSSAFVRVLGEHVRWVKPLNVHNHVYYA